DDGWLGVREVLPRVVVPGASAVILETPEGKVALTHVGEDTWFLPNQDLAGDFTIVASFGESDARRSVRFSAAPFSETFKPPSDPEAWITEEVVGTKTLASSIPFGTGRPL